MIGRFLQARGIPLASLMLVRQPVRLAVACLLYTSDAADDC